MAKTNEEKSKLAANLFAGAVLLENNEISAEFRDKLMAESFKLLDGVPQRLTAMDVHRFLAGELEVNNLNAEFKVELLARCDAQAQWLKNRFAATLEPGAYSPTVRDEAIVACEKQLRNIESRISSVRGSF